MTFKFMHRIGRVPATASILLGLAISALGQSPTPAPAAAATAAEFEVADIHPSPSRIHASVHGGMSREDRYFLRDATLTDLIAASYQVDPASVVGPTWLGFDRFDIYAKAPASTSFESTRPMVRALLAGPLQTDRPHGRADLACVCPLRRKGPEAEAIGGFGGTRRLPVSTAASKLQR